MTPLSPLRARAQRPGPATNPLGWVSFIELSDDERTALREHIERLLNLDEEAVQQEVAS